MFAAKDNNQPQWTPNRFIWKRKSRISNKTQEYLIMCSGIRDWLLEQQVICNELKKLKQEELYTNQEITDHLLEKYEEELEIFFPNITFFPETLYTAIDMLMKKLFDKKEYASIKSKIYSRIAKETVSPERLRKMSEASRNRDWIDARDDEHITYIKNLAKKHTRAKGTQIDRKKVVELFLEKYPGRSEHYMRRMIDMHALKKKWQHHRTKHPEYSVYIKNIFEKITSKNIHEYVLPYWKRYRLNSKRIITDFNSQFPNHGITIKSLSQRILKLKNESWIDIQALIK